MSKWPMVPLRDVISHRKEFIQIDDFERYKRCRVQLHARGIVLRDHVDGAEIKTKKQQVCGSGELLVAEIDAKHGGYGIVPDDLEGAIVSSHYFLFEIDLARLDRRFLGYYIQTPAFFDQVSAQGSTNYAAIRPGHVLEYQIPLPPLSEQQKIVEWIDAVATRVEEAKELRIESNEQTAALIFAETTRAYARLDRFPTCPIGELGVGKVGPVQTGPFGAQLHSSEYVDTGVPVLNVGNVWPSGIRLDRLDHVTEEKAAALNRYSIKTDDILFARSGATLGKVCIVPTECDGWIMSGHLFRVRLDHTRCLPQYLLAALRGAHFVRAQIFDQVRGATRPGFNTKLLSGIQIPLPPLNQQQRVVSHIEAVHDRINLLEIQQSESSLALSAMLPSALNKIFNGDGDG